MHLPNYKDGSIVNLMSSIGQAFNIKSNTIPLKILPPEKLREAKNIILLVVDGMGHEFIKSRGKETILNDYLIGDMTSVFPATTAAAITSYLTGVYPQQHANTGWYIYFKEIDKVCSILPFITREESISLKKYNIKIDEIIREKSFSSKLKNNNFIIQPTDLAYSEYSKIMSKNSKILAYNNLNGMLNKIKKAINSSNEKKYIYAYWPELDRNHHLYGVDSNQSLRHFKEIDCKLREFIKYIKKTDSILIITSDHGFVNSNKEKVIWIEDYPKIKECLKAPLSGEPRLAYCNVISQKKKLFESLIKTKFKKYCWIYKSSDLIKKDFFGFGKPSSQLIDRVGDFTLIMKENYILKDRVKWDKKKFKKGNHGGVSKEEMLVPLVVVEGKNIR